MKKIAEIFWVSYVIIVAIFIGTFRWPRWFEDAVDDHLIRVANRHPEYFRK